MAFLFLATICCCQVFAQRDTDNPFSYKNNNFQFSTFNSHYATLPIRKPLSVAGGFAEIRPNHFHSGLDIRTDGKEGEPVYAPEDGFVSRINISAWGGGKVLYIDHPDGYRTVYMHLSAFCGDIGRLVHDYQYANHLYEMNITLPKDSIRVKKGQLVALTGNTGGSSGPHLHYEIRLAENDQTINPLYFGLDYSDPVPPTIAGIKLYPADEHTIINGSSKELKIYPKPTPKKGKKPAPEQTLTVLGAFYCGIYTYDQHERGSHSKNGVEKIELYVDDSLFWRYHVPTFLFEETRAINAIIDYPQYQRNREYYLVTRHLRGNRNNFSTAYRSGGYIEFSDSRLHKLEYVVSDIKGNSARHTFSVRCKAADTTSVSHTDFLIPRGTPITYFKRCVLTEPGFSALFEPHTVYENDELLYSSSKDAAGLSAQHHLVLRNNPLPPHQAFTVCLSVPGKVPSELHDKLVVVCINGKRTTACATKRTDSLLKATTKSFGSFAVRLDTVPPKATPVNFASGKPFTKNSLQIKIEDNLSGVAKYSCIVNGRWELAEHDGKSSSIYIDASILHKGENTLKVTLTDAVGNTTEESYTIKR